MQLENIVCFCISLVFCCSTDCVALSTDSTRRKCWMFWTRFWLQRQACCLSLRHWALSGWIMQTKYSEKLAVWFIILCAVFWMNQINQFIFYLLFEVMFFFALPRRRRWVNESITNSNILETSAHTSFQSRTFLTSACKLTRDESSAAQHSAEWRNC